MQAVLANVVASARVVNVGPQHQQQYIPHDTISPAAAEAAITLSAERMAYHTAPAMLIASPAAFQVSKMKSPKANAPTIVMMAFLRLPE